MSEKSNQVWLVKDDTRFSVRLYTERPLPTKRVYHDEVWDKIVATALPRVAARKELGTFSMEHPGEFLVQIQDAAFHVTSIVDRRHDPDADEPKIVFHCEILNTPAGAKLKESLAVARACYVEAGLKWPLQWAWCGRGESIELPDERALVTAENYEFGHWYVVPAPEPGLPSAR